MPTRPPPTSAGRDPLPPRLEAALIAVADVLAALSEADWGRLCAQEQATAAATFQFWEAMGWPEVMLPERVLGARILEIYAARYPELAQDVAGTA